MLTTKVPGTGGASIQPSLAFDLQPALLVLQQDGDEARILVRADALIAFAPPRGRDSG